MGIWWRWGRGYLMLMRCRRSLHNLMCVALPTLIVYFALQRYFIAGLTIGAEKG
jgi:hypothetical protein